MAVEDSIKQAILDKIPDARVQVTPGSGGHYTLEVVSPVFDGKSMVDSQRLVLGSIAHLMKGDGAPVHAIDKLTTKKA